MRRLFISSDLEGCPAVSAMHALTPERFEWAAARRWMTSEVVAVSEAALEAGYDEVIVADSHHNGHNIDPDGLPDRVWLVRSWPRPLLHMQGAEQEGVAACAFLGYHAGSTATNSILAHSYHGGAFRVIRLNGRACSEGYLNAALAGELGRPVIFVSGDAATVEEAQDYAPEAVAFVTKQSIGWRSQMSLGPSHVQPQLKSAFVRALEQPIPQPFVLKPPFELELEMTSQTATEMLTFLPNVTRTGPWSVKSSFDSIRAVMGFVNFAAHYSPTGIVAN